MTFIGRFLIAVAFSASAVLSTPVKAQFFDGGGEGAVSFSVEPGSLRENLGRLAEENGWTLVAWDETVQRNNAVLDWKLLTAYTLEADSIDEALTQLIRPYGLHARLHEPDRAIAIYPFEKVRFKPVEEE